MLIINRIVDIKKSLHEGGFKSEDVPRLYARFALRTLKGLLISFAF